MSFFGESFRFYTPFILAFWLPSSPVAVAAPPVAAPPVAAPPVAAPPVAAPPVAAPPVANPSQKLQLETSDGLALSARYYAVTPQKPLATVLLLHDLEGSHKTVDPLAKLLQKNGFAVVAPDLRGHGDSTFRRGIGGKVETLDAKTLKRQELEAIPATAGGRVREQAEFRGDIEAVRNWISNKSTSGELDIQRLCVIGSGTGGTLAALWTAADWAWPPIATGPQGQQVRALVLISPTWAAKGISIVPALTSEGLKFQSPIMVIGGEGDRDASKVFDQLKRFRPQSWFQQRGDRSEKSPKLENAAKATAFLMQLETGLSADKLASDRTANAAARIQTFFTLVLDPKDE